MSRIGTFLIAFLLALGTAQGQSFRHWKPASESGWSLEASSVATRSIRGWKMGVQVGFIKADRFNFGGFTLSEIGSAENERRSFSGVYSTYYLFKKQRIQIGPAMKVGLFQKRFLALLPTLEGRVRINENVALSSGVGRSDRYPYFDFKLIIKLKSLN